MLKCLVRFVGTRKLRLGYHVVDCQTGIFVSQIEWVYVECSVQCAAVFHPKIGRFGKINDLHNILHTLG